MNYFGHFDQKYFRGMCVRPVFCVCGGKKLKCKRKTKLVCRIVVPDLELIPKELNKLLVVPTNFFYQKLVTHDLKLRTVPPNFGCENIVPKG